MDLSKLKLQIPDISVSEGSYSLSELVKDAFSDYCKNGLKGLYYSNTPNKSDILRSEFFESVRRHDAAMLAMYSNTVQWYVDLEAPLDLSSPTVKAIMQPEAQKAKPKRLVLEF